MRSSATTAGYVAVLLMAAMTPLAAIAGEATCSDYLKATGEDRALFNGFIYGYVMSRMERRGDAAINAATAKVTALTTKYCAEKPTDRVSNVIGMWASAVARTR